MSEKHTVAMFVQGEDGRRVQVGWASPKNNEGVRTFEYSPGYEDTRPKDVSFEDDELSQQVAEEQHEARTGDGSDGEGFEPIVENKAEFEVVTNDEAPLPAEPITEAPDEELAADPIDEQPDSEQADEETDATVTEDDEPVELDNGGQILEVADEEPEDEEAEFQRLLAEEEAEKNQPQTRREARESEDNA